jgi:hypothetical protein
MNMSSQNLETITSTDLQTVTGGGFWGDLRDATAGAVNIVSSPFSAAYRGVNGTVGALRQGHGVGDSLANGLVQAAGTMNAPNLSNIPAR